jgi:early secretory antigenic target protein ESAT-6
MEWEGQDQVAYQQHQAKWDQAVRDLNAVLNEIANAVGVARENYMSTEMSNSKLW